MATTETLSFDRHLRHAFAPLSARLENGIRSLDGVIEILRLRIEAEAQFAASLQKIISNEKLISYLSPAESLRKDGLDAIHADMRNEYTQRLEFLNSLNEDVYQPCVSIRELYAEKNRLFASDTKTHIKSLRQHQNQFYKIKTKYEKVCREASNARTALLNAKLDNKISSAQILKLGTKVNSTLKTQQTWKEKYDQQQLIWNRQQIKFDDEMTMILQGMQSNEYNRMKTSKDSMNKWAVFITNLCANRNYDVKNLAKSMSMINIDSDLQIFISKTLEKHPSKNPNGIGPPPPHHSLHYGKLHQNALNNLNKTSTDKSNLNRKVNTNPKPIKYTHSSSQLSTSHHQRNRSNNSLSLSSFGPSFTGNHSRKHSQSYSLSGQQDIMNELSKRQLRQNSSRTPNSIGSFFKQKFQKQRSYNSQRMPDTHMNHHQSREPSNTISSYARDGSVVLPDGVVDYDDHSSPIKHHYQSPQSPKSLPITNINVINGSGDNAIDIINIADPEIPNSPKSVNLTLNHHNHNHNHNQNSTQTNTNSNTNSKTNTNRTSSQINRTMKKKKLNKPKMRRKKKQSIKQSIKLTNSNTQHTPKQSPNQKPITPTPITPMIMDVEQNQNQKQLDNHQNISLYKNVNNHNSQQIIKQLTHSPKPQIIVIKKKSKSPRSRNNSNNNLHNNNNNNHNTYTINTKIDNSSSDEALPSGGSTPTLSGGSDNDNDNDKKDDIIPTTSPTNINNDQPSKPDTPLPKHKKKKILYSHKSNESANLEFAANHIINRKIRHSYAESEDDFDPLD